MGTVSWPTYFSAPQLAESSTVSACRFFFLGRNEACDELAEHASHAFKNWLSTFASVAERYSRPALSLRSAAAMRYAGLMWPVNLPVRSRFRTSRFRTSRPNHL